MIDVSRSRFLARFADRFKSHSRNYRWEDADSAAQQLSNGRKSAVSQENKNPARRESHLEFEHKTTETGSTIP